MKQAIEKQPITERIKTMEDVILELGAEHPLVKEYQHWLNTPEECRSEYTGVFIQLKMLCEALNEGDFPLSFSRYVYWPWIELFEDKNDIPKYFDQDRIFEIPKNMTGVYFGGYAFSGAYCGFAYASAYGAPSATSANIGSRLCFKKRELAWYAGKQFHELWLKFYFM